MTRQFNEFRKALDVHSAENGEEIASVKTDISSTLSELKLFQDKVNIMEIKLSSMTSKLEDTQKMLDVAKNGLFYGLGMTQSSEVQK